MPVLNEAGSPVILESYMVQTWNTKLDDNTLQLVHLACDRQANGGTAQDAIALTIH